MTSDASRLETDERCSGYSFNLDSTAFIAPSIRTLVKRDCTPKLYITCSF